MKTEKFMKLEMIVTNTYKYIYIYNDNDNDNRFIKHKCSNELL